MNTKILRDLIESLKKKKDPESALPFNSDPLSILEDPLGNGVNGLQEYINIAGIVTILKQIILYGSFLITIACLIALFFVDRAEMIKERKAAIIYRLGLVLASSSAITIFNIVKKVLDELFGII